MKETSVNHPATFDQSEHDILSNLVENDEPVTVDDQPGEAATPPAPVEPAETAKPVESAEAATTEATTSAEPAPPQGDPRAALRASRRAEKRLRDELEQIRSENEALKQGKQPVDLSITDAELAELEADFPLQAKIARKQREIEAQLKQAQPQVQAEFEAPSYDSGIQDVIDSVPDLVAWQYDPAQQDKFFRAVEYDKALSVDPDWRDRDITERFTEAARRSKAALSPSSAAPAAAAPAAQRTNPAAVIAAAPVQGPKGISDFRGGAPANTQTVNYQGMSDEQIMASLPMA
jgi:hypothetical protein